MRSGAKATVDVGSPASPGASGLSRRTAAEGAERVPSAATAWTMNQVGASGRHPLGQSTVASREPGASASPEGRASVQPAARWPPGATRSTRTWRKRPSSMRSTSTSAPSSAPERSMSQAERSCSAALTLSAASARARNQVR